VKKDKLQLEKMIKEFQDCIKTGGNLLEFMRKCVAESETEEKEKEKEKEKEDIKEKDDWSTLEISSLKEGLKEHSGIKDPKEKFKLISQMVGSKT